MVLTNQLRIELFSENIGKDFSVLRFTQAETIKKSPLFLDRILDEQKALAALFEPYGKEFYVLFNKIEDLHLFRTGLYENEELKAYTLDLVKPDRVERVKLAQLMINSLSNSARKTRQFNNLTGSLLYFLPELFKLRKSEGQSLVWQIPVIKFSISANESLQLRVITFTNIKAKDRLSFKKRRFEEYPQYTYVPATQTLRRKGEGVSGETFIQKQFKSTKSHIDFLDISSLSQFQASKSGLVRHFLSLVKEKLGSYLSLTPQELGVQEVKKFEGVSYSAGDGFSFFLQENKFCLVDLVDTPVSDLACDEFLQLAKDSYSVFIKKAAKASRQRINFVLIHNKEYFKDFPNEDHYGRFQNPETVIQHVTFEDLFLSSEKILKLRKSDSRNAVVNVLFKEACVKNDIKQGKISLINWKQFDYAQDWIFGLRADEKIYFLKISQEGRLTFRVLDAFSSLFDSSEFQVYADLMLDKEDGNENHAIEGFVKNDQGEINLIERTELFTLPNISQLHSSLEKEAAPVSFAQQELLDLLHSFQKLFEKYKAPIEAIIRAVEKQNQDTWSREDVIRLFDKKSMLKEFSYYVYDRTGQVLRNYFRDALQKYELISSQLSVNYTEVIPEKEALYFVGTKDRNVNLKFARSSVIRKVRAPEGHRLFFDQLLPLMNVDFVKNEDLTVLPFPFKYLREYIGPRKNGKD